jgi:sRNA-binding regulator protein Hfq
MNIWQNNPLIWYFLTDKAQNSYTNTSLVRSTAILLCLSNGINTNAEITQYCKYSIFTV